MCKRLKKANEEMEPQPENVAGERRETPEKTLLEKREDGEAIKLFRQREERRWKSHKEIKKI